MRGGPGELVRGEQPGNDDRITRAERTCERKIELVKKWRRTLAHEREEIQSRLSITYQYLDSDLAKAIAVLERMIGALDKYAERATPSAAAVDPAAVETNALEIEEPTGSEDPA